MRIILLFGLALPVLAVSGAVAFGAIREISRSLAPAPIVQDTATVPSRPGPAALDFVAAGKTAWDVPQSSAFFVPTFQDQSIKTTAPVGLGQHGLGALRPGGIDQPEGRVATPKPEALRPVRQPRVIVTAKDRAARSPIAVQTPAKRSFKMPWQTGIFQ